jgi:hypothetical protein
MFVSHLNNKKLTLIGLAFLVPALLLEFAGMSKFWWSPTNPLYLAFETVFSDSRFIALNVVAQALVIVGPALAVVLCILPILRVSLRREADMLIGTVAIKGNVVNLVIVACGLIGMAVIAAYIIGENAPCILGYKLSC